MSLEVTLEWTHRLIAFACFLQGVEILAIRSSWSDRRGIWSWRILKQDFPSGLSFLLSEKAFLYLICIHIIVAASQVLLIHPIGILILFVITCLISYRWRGTFNGGSDYMTSLILLALVVASYADLRWQTLCVFFIAVQLLLSYFLAGFYKIKERSWRSGSALYLLLRESHYVVPDYIKALTSKTSLVLALSWFVMIFEIAFIVSLKSPFWTLAFIASALIFHMLNFVVFGLNRFVFSWLAAYPSLYFLSLALQP